jgi:mRNA interferase MazF
MRRGDIVTVALQGDLGKPRPAVVIQSDWLDETATVLVCPLTGTLRDAPVYRLDVPALPATGLRLPSQIMVEKIVAVRREKCGPPIGRLDAEALISLGRMLALMVGVGD